MKPFSPLSRKRKGATYLRANPVDAKWVTPRAEYVAPRAESRVSWSLGATPEV